MSPIQFTFLYALALWGLRIWAFWLLGSYFLDLAQFALSSGAADLAKKILDAKAFSQEILPLAAGWGKRFAWALGGFAGLMVAQKALQAAPMPARALAYWDRLGELGPIAGRRIAQALRRSGRVSFAELSEAMGCAQSELSRLRRLEKSEACRHLMERYDPNFRTDIPRKKAKAPEA